jgi:hypothetical protein
MIVTLCDLAARQDRDADARKVTAADFVESRAVVALFLRSVAFDRK